MPYFPALGLMFLTLVAWRKGWPKTGILLAFLAVAYAFTVQEWVQDILKAHMSPLVRQQLNDAKALKELRKTVDGVSQRVTAQQAVLDAQDKRLTAQEGALSAQQQAWDTVKTGLEEARQLINTHQQQLGDVGAFVQDMSGGAVTESLSAKDKGRLILLPFSNKAGTAYLQLSHVPRAGTLKVQWESVTFAPQAYTTHKNIVAVRLADDVKKFNKHPFSIRYIPDTSRTQEHAAMLLQNGVVYADGEKLPDLFAAAPAVASTQ